MNAISNVFPNLFCCFFSIDISVLPYYRQLPAAAKATLPLASSISVSASAALVLSVVWRRVGQLQPVLCCYLSLSTGCVSAIFVAHHPSPMSLISAGSTSCNASVLCPVYCGVIASNCAACTMFYTEGRRRLSCVFMTFSFVSRSGCFG